MSKKTTFTPKPNWLKVKAPGGENYKKIKEKLRGENLYTVCEEARCPNVAECWGGGTATMMLMGDTCTRGCRFCAVKTARNGIPLDPEEPQKVYRSVELMDLEYIVLTSVDRDDLPDGGAQHFTDVVRYLHNKRPGLLVEVLTSDFAGDIEPIAVMASSGAQVLAHNIETTRRLTRVVRDVRCKYDQSLEVLRLFKKFAPESLTKSSIMLGLGEEDYEIEQTLVDLRDNNVDVVTLRQYLRPGKKYREVMKYYHPDEFAKWKQKAEEMGFLYVASGPLVRSSYKAGEYFIQNYLRRREGNEQRITTT